MYIISIQINNVGNTNSKSTRNSPHTYSVQPYILLPPQLRGLLNLSTTFPSISRPCQSQFPFPFSAEVFDSNLLPAYSPFSFPLLSTP